MSENNESTAPAETSEDAPKARKKLFILIGTVVIFILVLIGGYGTVAYLQHFWPFAGSEGPTAEQIAAGYSSDGSMLSADVDMSDQYIRFDSAFTFNLPGKGRRGHMVQVEAVLLVHGSANAALAQQHLPLISATISEICAQQTFEDLVSSSGRQRFKRLLLDGVRTRMTGLINQPLVEQVLFINFVMQ